MCCTSLLAMLPELRSGKIKTFARPATLLSGSFRARLLVRERRRRLNLADARVRGAPLRRVGEQRDAWLRAKQMPRELRCGHRDVGELFNIRLRNHAAIRQEHHALLAEP